MKTAAACRLPELLAPAGSREKLEAAIRYGADAVYLGASAFSLRARAANFDEEGLAAAIDLCHRHRVKAYVTVNIFAHERDLAPLRHHLPLLARLGADGIIVADAGVLRLARELAPELPLHLSTQANVTNGESARFWQQQGVRRLNLARELRLDEIRTLRRDCDAELELFVHGAVCIAYSGRCLLSNYFTDRDANQGDCAQPCRYRYRLLEEKRPGQFFPLEEDRHGSYILNARDLCLIDRLPELLSLGVDALKIEGRMKTLYYVGGTVRVYRAALDWLGDRLAGGADAASLRLPPEFAAELGRIGTRDQAEHFADGPPGPETMLYHNSRCEQAWVPLGIIRGLDPLMVELRCPVRPGDALEYLGPGLATPTAHIRALGNAEGQTLERGQPGAMVRLELAPPLPDLRLGGILRTMKPMPPVRP
ncbi:MAG: peptidase U32 [Desulfobulbaceae bacterium A2]|nr:MAG: peptidase U32 [Desulfobulbaceae bacterium A2]